VASARVSDEQDGFGDRLRAGRRRAGLSQEELADRAGLSVRAIGNLERGRASWPHRETLQRLADALELRGAAGSEFIGSADRGLASAFAPLGGAEADDSDHHIGRGPGRRVAPRQLPAPVPGFAGRGEELALLSRVLGPSDTPSVVTTIGGTAGVGKTALAVYWAHQAAGDFPDGQLFVNLRGFDPSGMPVAPDDAVRVFLEGLGVAADQLPTTAEAQLGLYRSLLAGKRILLLLDNARDEAQVRPLLPGSPSCRVVVTSRSQLTGLIAAEAAAPLILDVLTSSGARQLLRQRLGGERLAAEDAATERIIASSARLPLALCIIAARTAVRPDVSLAQVAADLAASPDLAEFTAAGDPAADVRTALSWSYRQLTDEVARVFRLAGLHPGPDLEPYAVAALAGLSLVQAGEALATLARVCLIQPAGPGRYALHDLLRRYAGELTAAGDSQDDRHAALTRLFDYYLYTGAAAADQAFPAERGRRAELSLPAGPVPVITTAPAARRWLDAQRPSLVAMAVCAAERGWPGHALRLAGTTRTYLTVGGYLPDATTIQRYALRAARAAGDRAAEATAITDLGFLAWLRNSFEQAARHHREAVPVFREVGDRLGEARALHRLGLAERQLGRNGQALSRFRQVLDISREIGERHGEARALNNLGIIEQQQGRYQQAAAHLREALTLCREIRDRLGEAVTLSQLGTIALREGRHEEAAGLFQRAIDLCGETGNRRGAAAARYGLGMVALAQGFCEPAAAQLQRALGSYRDVSDQCGEAEVLNGLGEVCLAAGQIAAAHDHHAAALRLAASISDRRQQACAHYGLGRVYRASGEPGRAYRHEEQALLLFTGLGAPEADDLRAQLREKLHAPVDRIVDEDEAAESAALQAGC
jgi:tetratricopeptide (TPR) repeat protein/transcriptional regulator with XRE-family HTH domain